MTQRPQEMLIYRNISPAVKEQNYVMALFHFFNLPENYQMIMMATALNTIKYDFFEAMHAFCLH